MKRCTRCGKEYPATREFFYPDKRRQDGVGARCLSCQPTKEMVRAGLVQRPKPAPAGETTCLVCGNTYPANAQFFHTNISSGHGWSKTCKQCTNERYKKWRKDNPQKSVRSAYRGALRRNFGISLEEYEAILAAQGGVCAVCHSPRVPSDSGKRVHLHPLHVDHDHRTGVVRGLLCYRCNTALGYFRDDIRLLGSAIHYLGGEVDRRATGDSVLGSWFGTLPNNKLPKHAEQSNRGGSSA